jgi:tetratricopeptide (TPR) repeat protein
MLRSAAVRDSFLGPVQSTLTWALIRQGRREESRRTLDRYESLASGTTTGTFSFPSVLELAFSQRFPSGGSDSLRANVLEGARQDPGAAVDLVLHTLRWAPSLELCQAELTIADAVIAIPGLVDSIRLNAFEAKGVALAALGRMDAAIVAFDSAAVIGGTPEYRLQAGQWRLLPSALGLPSEPAETRATGRRIVTALLDEPSVAARAAWTLGMDALAHGDTVSGERWRDSLAASTDSVAPRLAVILEGLAAALHDDWWTALSKTESLGAYDDKARGGDPFVRSILHFNRGQWFDAIGRYDEADRAWRWYLNADVVDWLIGPVQAAEIDWVSEGVAALSRARMLAAHDHPGACELFGDAARRWADADSAMVHLADEARTKASECK